MKSRTQMWMTVVSLFAALAMPIGIFAQENNPLKREANHHTYKLIDLGTFGGPNSDVQGPLAQILNSRGTVAGGADTATPDPSNPCFNPVDVSDCFVEHAFKWRDGTLTDLGTLPGGLFSYSLWINDRGVVAGSSENGLVDPLTNSPETRAVIWAGNQVIDLGTLGGNQSGAIGVNNLDQVIGFALNATPDDALPLSEIVGAGVAATECRAFLWQKGKMYDLGTLGGPDAFAQFVNDGGQVAGFSYTSSTVNPIIGIPPIHAFLWDHRMIDLGTLGGAFALVDDLNNVGQVVGPMDLAGDLTYHPFLWDRGVLKDLGTLGGDNGEAFWINDAGEAVGDADLPGPGQQLHHAFLWKHGAMMDLGTVDGDSCSVAMFISSRGQITGSSN